MPVKSRHRRLAQRKDGRLRRAEEKKETKKETAVGGELIDARGYPVVARQMW
jgi:hypothetical protein